MGEEHSKPKNSKNYDYNPNQKSDKKKSNFPNSILTQKHLQFFYKYGFVLLHDLHSKQQIQEARKGAQFLLQEHVKLIDGGKGEQAFRGLPEHKRSAWGRCEEPKLMKYFEYDKNHKLCEDIIGEFKFEHHYPGPGYYTFAPRFYEWAHNPKVAMSDNEVKTTEPYDINNLPQSFSDWSKQFLTNAAELGIRFAPSDEDNWHLDGVDYNSVGFFNILWGSYLNSLPKGNMGNLTIFPGTHHVLADILKVQGPYFYYDGKKEKPKPLPNLEKEGIADGKPYSLLVEAGDILLAHPWLAHGIGVNLSKEIRLAVYCRLANMNFYMNCRSEMAGIPLIPMSDELPEPKKWVGDYWANVPLLNEWIKNNKECLREYDNGRLEKALKNLH